MVKWITEWKKGYGRVYPGKEKRNMVLRRRKVDIRIHIIIIPERLKKILYPREIPTDTWKLNMLIK